MHHTAQASSNGTRDVSGSTRYRIASNTKLFTAIGILQQQNAGNLSLDDPVSKYVTDLPRNGGINWAKITSRALLSHMGGVPDNYAEDEVLLTLDDPTAYGLPPISHAQITGLPDCEGFSNYTTACSEKDFFKALEIADPVALPNVVTSYSNIGFDLLGIVLSNVTGVDYQDYISAKVLEPLAMYNTSFVTPDVSVSVVPNASYFGVDLGVGNPSGGLYSTSSDMIKFLQNALKTHNNVSSAMDWFQPAAYGPGSHSSIGYAWEIFRSSGLLPNSTRAVTVSTKGGGLAGFYSYSMVMPTYDLAAFMVVGGDSSALNGLNTIFDTVRKSLPAAAERIAQAQLAQGYAGTYTAAAVTYTADISNFHPDLNSSMTILQSDDKSLYVGAWTSNSTNALNNFIQLAAQQAGQNPDLIYFQFVPTFETRQGANGTYGEVWRFINVLRNDVTIDTWNDYCVSILDPLSYAQVPLNEIVFWRASAGSRVTEIELSAFQIRMGLV